MRQSGCFGIGSMQVPAHTIGRQQPSGCMGSCMLDGRLPTASRAIHTGRAVNKLLQVQAVTSHIVEDRCSICDICCYCLCVGDVADIEIIDTQSATRRRAN